MKIYAVLIAFFMATMAFGQSSSVKKVNDAVKALHAAIIARDSVMLKRLTAPALSFGHSAGAVENQQKFITNTSSGPFVFQSIDVTDQKIDIQKRTAIVRHVLTGKATNNGTPTDVKIGILQLWQKQKGAWKLLARQAYKL